MMIHQWGDCLTHAANIKFREELLTESCIIYVHDLGLGFLCSCLDDAKRFCASVSTIKRLAIIISFGYERRNNKIRRLKRANFSARLWLGSNA